MGAEGKALGVGQVIEFVKTTRSSSGLAMLNRFLPPLLCDLSNHPSGQSERTVMKKRAKLTSTGHIPGALSRFEISGIVHDMKFSGSHQNTSREGRRQGPVGVRVAIRLGGWPGHKIRLAARPRLFPFPLRSNVMQATCKNSCHLLQCRLPCLAVVKKGSGKCGAC